MFSFATAHLKVSYQNSQGHRHWPRIQKCDAMRTDFVKNNMCLSLLWYTRNSPIGASGFVIPDVLFAYCSSCSKFALVVSIWLDGFPVDLTFGVGIEGGLDSPPQKNIVNFGGKLGLFTKVCNLDLFLGKSLNKLIAGYFNKLAAGWTPLILTMFMVIMLIFLLIKTSSSTKNSTHHVVHVVPNDDPFTC